ncbi:TPA: hypothetical protein PC505_000226 [Morganella morganii]|uniref:hypothetical protein n=1 Tax=Morganella morganii TaxID=582 RepID=UPI001A21CD69|nr:hypothetical protein [Morganella morganii]HAT1513827.1 hypothetical protein [Morganella morganii]HAT1526035.1 hypothetical protein [Morganella morganii]HDF2340904.1 hypothetical protein [Morganella morganii]HDF2362908.1 hypothetical protein [Morganella morganii]HDF2420876.1 hypothetical protein [Morganella morganii]
MKKRARNGKKNDVLTGVKSHLNRIEMQMETLGDRMDVIRQEATQGALRRGAVAGAVSGGITACLVTTALILLRAKMGL